MNTQLQGGVDNLKRSEDASERRPNGGFPLRQVVALAFSRAICRVSIVFTISSSTEFLEKSVCHGKALDARILLTKMNSVENLLSFWTGPLKAALLDRFGRKAGMVQMTLAAAGAKAIFCVYPSRATFFAYRLAFQFFANFFSGYQVL